MRLPEEQIKQAILHPELPVRTLVLQYFAHSFSEDTTIMPLVIKVIETYGRELSIPFIREIASLPQTEATIEWCMEELRQDLALDNEISNDYQYACVLSNVRCIDAFLLKIFQARAVGQRVVGNIQDVVRFVIRKVDLQSLDMPIDGIDQPTLLRLSSRQPDSTVTRRGLSLGKFVLNASRRQQGTLVILALVFGALPDLEFTFSVARGRIFDPPFSRFLRSYGRRGLSFLIGSGLHLKSLSASRIVLS